MIPVYITPALDLLKHEDMYKKENTHTILRDIQKRLMAPIFYNRLFYNESMHNGIFIRRVKEISSCDRTEDGLFNINIRVPKYERQRRVFNDEFRLYKDGLYIVYDKQEEYDDFRHDFLRRIPKERHCEYDMLLEINND